MYYPRALWLSTVLVTNISTCIMTLRVYHCFYTVMALCCLNTFHLLVSEYRLRPHTLYEDIEIKCYMIQSYVFCILSMFPYITWQLLLLSTVILFYILDQKHIARQMYVRLSISLTACWAIKAIVWGACAWWGFLPYLAALVYYTTIQTSYNLDINMTQKLNAIYMYKTTHQYIWFIIHYGFITTHYYPRIFHWDILYYSHLLTLCFVCVSMSVFKRHEQVAFRLTRSEDQYGRIIPPTVEHMKRSVFWSSHLCVNDLESKFL